jgi:hypothetical protein
MKFLIGDLDPVSNGAYDGSGINPNPQDVIVDNTPEVKTPTDDLQDGVKKLNWTLIALLGLIGLTIVLSRKEG